MKSRYVVRLFFSTLMVGGISTVILSLFMRWSEYIELMEKDDIVQVLSLLLWFTSVGFMFSLVSQMGFFGYLTIHRLGLNFFKSKGLWDMVQVVLICTVIGDFLFFQSIREPLDNHIFLVIVIVGISFIVAYLKVKQTNKDAFVPSVFFMIVVTLVELIPAIQADNNQNWLIFMLIPLLICNGFQLFMLYHLQGKELPELSNPI